MKKSIKELINQINNERITHFADIIRRHKANCPNLPSWFTDKPVYWYETMLESQYMQIEDLLHCHNKYNGFREIEVEGLIVRKYYINHL